MHAEAIELLMVYPGFERQSIIRELLNPQSEESKIDSIINKLFGTAMTDPDAMLAELSPSERDQVFDELVKFRHEELAEAVANSNDNLGSDDPRYLDAESLALAQQEAVENADLRIDDISLSQLEAWHHKSTSGPKNKVSFD